MYASRKSIRNIEKLQNKTNAIFFFSNVNRPFSVAINSPKKEDNKKCFRITIDYRMINKH